MNSIYDYDDISVNVDEFDVYTGKPKYNAVLTIQLGELVEGGVFDWSKDLLNWSSAAYDADQYKRVCEYFIERFYYREISMLPFKQWANFLKRKLVYELMPKYKPLYERVAEGINPLVNENEYYKNRTIESAYPETLLSANADYITDGKDEEYQRIKEGSTVDNMVNFAQSYKGVDELLLDELECLFVGMYSVNVNAIW